MAGPHQRQCIADLLLQLLAMGVRIVHHQDIQQFQVQPVRASSEMWDRS